MRNLNWKKFLPYVIAIVVFLVFTAIYCFPVLQGKVIEAHDTLSWEGMYQEAKEYHEQTGNYTFWTGSMFSGMPTYQIGGGKIPSSSFLSSINKVFNLGITNSTFVIIFGYLIGFFILLRSFKVNIWLSIAGAIAIALSSYFFIIIEAGHNTKAIALGRLAPVIGGMYLIFKRKYIPGTILVLIFTALGITQHPQMSYYIFMLIGVLVLTECYTAIKTHKLKPFFIALTIFCVAVLIGVGSRYTYFQINREYVKETMRGGHSELTGKNDQNNKTDGLDLDYATAWSYGIDETMTLLIPNFKGASSHYDAGKGSKVYKALTQNGMSPREADTYVKNLPTYWGTQPFTSGPVYVGAIICFLFVLCLFIVKGPLKWGLLIATIFSILLAWGRNFMPLTELFFHYFPMYNKFRAVSSILIVAEITMPLMGFLAIQAIVDKSVSKKEILGAIKKSTYITGGICLFFALFGGMLFNFTSPSDAQLAQMPGWFMNALTEERASMLRNDSFRSLIFVLLGAVILWLYVNEKIKLSYFVVGLVLFITLDMWPVNKHFLNDDSFVSPQKRNSYFRMQPYEEQILQDKDPHFRVFNLTTNTFNDSRTSYYLKSIGGYHAAKLRRYQDLIDRHLSKMHWPVINMLNTKYIIFPHENRAMVQRNQDAMGNAWFVDSVHIANTPNEEIDALNQINLRNTLVTDQHFSGYVKDFVPGHDSTARITLLSYAPDALEYRSSSSKEGIAVFSEVYYPSGWKVYINNEPVEHFRANYTLRALNIPAGEHHIRFEFRPDVVSKSEVVSVISIILMLGVVVAGVVFCLSKRRSISEEAN